MNTPFSVFRFLAIIAFLGVFYSGIFIKTVKAQQLDIAKQVAGGETFDKSLRLESTEKVMREGNLGPRSFSYALNNILKLKKDEPLYKELMKFCPTGKSGGGPVGSCSLEDASKGLQQ